MKPVEKITFSYLCSVHYSGFSSQILYAVDNQVRKAFNTFWFSKHDLKRFFSRGDM